MRSKGASSADILSRMASDADLRSSASQIGIDTASLQERPKTAFQLAKDEREEIVELRMRYHERQREQLARELEGFHANVQTCRKRLDRVVSSTSLKSNPSAASLTSSPSASLLKGDNKRLEALRAARVKTSDEWFESQHKEAAIIHENAVLRHQTYLDRSIDARRAGTPFHRDRAQRTLMQQDYAEYEQREQRRATMHTRLERAASRKEAALHRQESKLQRQRERAAESAAKAEERRQQRAEEHAEHAEALVERLGKQDAHVQDLYAAREHACQMAREKGRLVTEDHEARTHRQWVAKQVEASFMRAKHAHVDAKLQALNEQKAEAMAQRRAASVRSSQVRDAIRAVFSEDWQSKLRWTPPEDDLLEEALGRPLSRKERSGRVSSH